MILSISRYYVEGGQLADPEEDTEADFFDGKRPWSRIKDAILGNYMTPYLRKVASLGPPILLVDAFAGPGMFGDGSTGSPVIMCRQGDAHAPNRYTALFVNEREDYHTTLQQTLRSHVDRGIAFPVHGDAQDLLRRVHEILDGSTVFIYLDPFGLKGCDFSTIANLLRRGTKYSTEMVINVSMPTVHRLAARKAVADGRIDSSPVKWRHKMLSNVLGGEFWRDILFEDVTDKTTREEAVMRGYVQNLKTLLPYAGFCPIRASRDSYAKYYMTFCSRHPDAMILMNNVMFDAYHAHLSAIERESIPLIAPALDDWKAEHTRSIWATLKEKIRFTVGAHPQQSRADIWKFIVEDEFMNYHEREYKKAVDELVTEGVIESPTSRRSRRLNDECILIPRS